MPKLGVNIDHVATLRQARREFDPCPVAAALLCQKSGADSIVAHLREDQRHISKSDVIRLKKALSIPFNLEMSLNKSIVDIVLTIKPDQITIVPEKRQELTTEGGLNVVKNFSRIKPVVEQMKKKGVKVSLFIDPVKRQILETKKAGVEIIELHTGLYARLTKNNEKEKELNKINEMTQLAHSLGLEVNAGHGLKYHNTKAVARIKNMNELNIGHSIISEAVFIGLEAAVKKMKALIK